MDSYKFCEYSPMKKEPLIPTSMTSRWFINNFDMRINEIHPICNIDPLCYRKATHKYYSARSKKTTNYVYNVYACNEHKYGPMFEIQHTKCINLYPHLCDNDAKYYRVNDFNKIPVYCEYHAKNREGLASYKSLTLNQYKKLYNI